MRSNSFSRVVGILRRGITGAIIGAAVAGFVAFREHISPLDDRYMSPLHEPDRAASKASHRSYASFIPPRTRASEDCMGLIAEIDQVSCQIALAQLHLHDINGVLETLKLVRAEECTDAIMVLLNELKEDSAALPRSPKRDARREGLKVELATMKRALPTFVSGSEKMPGLLIAVADVETTLGEDRVAKETLREAFETMSKAAVSSGATERREDTHPKPAPRDRRLWWIPFGAILGFIFASLFKPILEWLGKFFFLEPLMKALASTRATARTGSAADKIELDDTLHK